MGNVKINAGGIIGGVLGMGIAGVLVWGVLQAEASRAGAKAVIIGLIGGALLGNVIWAKLISKNEDELPD